MYKLFYKISLISIIVLSAVLLYQKHTYAYHTLVRVDPLPHTKVLISQEKYADAQEYLEYFMQFDYVSQVAEAQDLLRNIQTKRESFEYRSNKIFEGIYTGTSDEMLGQVSAISSDFFLIGDLRDLAIEGSHYFKDEKVDTVLVSLSGIGLVASVSTFFTFGTSSTAKGGISVLKLAHRSNKIPSWLKKYLLRQSRQIRETKSIQTVKPLLNNISDIHEEVGLKNTLKILSKSKNTDELETMSTLSKHYGKNTVLMLDLSNTKLLTHTDTLRHYDKNTVKLATSYADNGFIQLLKGGEKHFIKTTKRMKSYAKVGYKGEIWKVFLSLMKHLSDTILIAMLSIASLLLFPFKKLKN
ncbi:MAG: hypothetical protein COB07_08490 [Sulfurovum sp.]|nr:MAG: hypothetical protein COB07_08490 [Sulfurovum sp.]